MAVTGESRTEQVSFEGHASAVVIVTGFQECPAKRYELMLECLALDSSSGPLPLRVYIWDDREAGWCREYYGGLFKIGTCWRISGKIDFYDAELAFFNPVYMPFHGEACELLRQHANLPEEAK